MIVFFLEVLALRSAAQMPSKLDPFLQRSSHLLTGRTRVHWSRSPATRPPVPAMRVIIQQLGGTVGLSLPIIQHGIAATFPNAALALLAASNTVDHLAFDRPVAGTMERTGATIGAATVRQEFGLDGSGIGIAVIDSGIAQTLDDLSDAAPPAQRVDQFVDFVSGAAAAYDDYGHGTHVAGIIAGNGADSSGARSGIAPAAQIIALKVLDSSGHGRISDVDRGARLCGRASRRAQHPGDQPVGRHRGVRIVYARPADDCRATRRGRRHRRRGFGRQCRAGRPGADAVPARRAAIVSGSRVYDSYTPVATDRLITRMLSSPRCATA